MSSFSKGLAFCNDLGSFRCVLQQFGIVLLRSAAILGRSAAFCSDLGPFCGVLLLLGAHSLEHELIL